MSIPEGDFMYKWNNRIQEWQDIINAAIEDKKKIFSTSSLGAPVWPICGDSVSNDTEGPDKNRCAGNVGEI